MVRSMRAAGALLLAFTALLPVGRLAAQDPSAPWGALRYRNVGPARGGRVTTVTGVPQQPHTFYMGTTGGGVWKTTDAGQSWYNVTDGFLTVGSMGDVDVADSDPNVVYAGTGSDGIRSNVSIGRGIWRSGDAGKTWEFRGLREMGQLAGVEVDPTNPNRVFVAAMGDPFKPTNARGVYRTTDGGGTWERVLYVSDSTGAVDVEYQPGNPQVVYAAMYRGERKPWTIISGAREGGIYKSADGGTTWRKLGGGLPTGLVGKANIAVSAAAPNVVYVLIEALPGGGLYRSDDAGETFRQVSDNPQLITRPFYYTNITANPKDAEQLWVGTEGFYESTDGGKTWRTRPTPHGDNHDLWVNPNDPAIRVQGNDGGATVTLNGGRTWSTLYNQPTAEIYQVAVDNQFPYRLYGAQQDNSTLIVPSRPVASGAPDSPLQSWMQGPGCETGPVLPHRTNPDTVYGSCKGQYSRLSLRTGQEWQYWVGGESLYGMPGKDLTFRFQRVSPMELSPHDTRTLYYGSQYLHRTRDDGVTWERISPDLTWNPPERQQRTSGEPITVDATGEEMYSTLYAIRESGLEPGVIWTGANDGPFYLTRDGGKSWKNVTPKAQPAGCRVQNIEPSPHRRGSAYFAVLCYLLGDFKPYLWRTDDYGRSWTLLTTGTNGIPADEPTRVVREDPDRAGVLYAGTEFGMWISLDDGATWRSFQLNMPRTPVTDLRVHRKDLVLSTQGRSFWILEDLTPVHQLAAAQGKAAHLFAPRVTVRHRYRAAFGGLESSREDPSDPQYAPPGVNLDYTLAAAPTAPITLQVLDSAGTVLRSWASVGAGEQTSDVVTMRAPAQQRTGTPRIPASAGHNRFTWDLTVAGPAGMSRGGPMVPPGRYRARLIAGRDTLSQPFTLTMDPRLAADGITPAVSRSQFAFNLQVRDLVTAVNALVADVEAARTRYRGMGAAGADSLAAVERLRARLVSPAFRYSKPELQAQIQYLYGMTTQADQRVGGDARARYARLKAQLAALQDEARPYRR